MRITLFTFLLSATTFTYNVVANPNVQFNKDALINVISENSQRECGSPSYLSCMEISESACFNINKKFISECVESLPDFTAMDDEIGQRLDNCGSKLAKKLRFDIDKSSECGDEIENEESIDPDYDWATDIDPQQLESMLNDGIDIKDIEKMVTAKHLQQENMEMVAEQVRLATGTGTRLDEVTLPLYQPHEVTVHMAEYVEFDNVKFLPVISLKVKATQEQVFAFYKQKLPTFKEDPDLDFLLVKKVIAGKNIYKYADVPNINLLSLDAETTLIQIYYRP